MPDGFWFDIKNQREFLDYLATQVYHLSNLDDWYSIRSREIEDEGATAMLSDSYRNSYVAALQTIYPEVEWYPWKFSRVGPVRISVFLFHIIT